MRALTTFSRTFDTKGKFDTGLFLKLFASRPGFFNRGLISELLNDAGTHPVSKEKLMIFVSKGRSSCKHNFNSHVGTGSCSQD